MHWSDWLQHDLEARETFETMLAGAEREAQEQQDVAIRSGDVQRAAVALGRKDAAVALRTAYEASLKEQEAYVRHRRFAEG